MKSRIFSSNIQCHMIYFYKKSLICADLLLKKHFLFINFEKVVDKLLKIC